MTLVLILIAIGTNAAHAAVGDMTIVGGMDFGFKQLRLDTGDGRNTFSPFYVTINPSIVLGYKSFYASLSYDKSISSDPETGQGTGLNQSFNVFAGYTKGANEFTDIRADVVLIVTDIEYTTTGPFAGVAYGKSFGKKGTLGLSIGYAELDGELRFTGRPSAGGSTDVDGDVTGLSYGVTWSGPLSESLGYRAGVKATRYKMEDPGDITERYTNIFFGIVNYF
jgi:hypothetical protein